MLDMVYIIGSLILYCIAGFFAWFIFTGIQRRINSHYADTRRERYFAKIEKPDDSSDR